MSGNTSPVRLATDSYYWKPMAAYFRTFELRTYVASSVTLPEPTLDLGCGDGLVADMLRRQGTLTGDCFGIDLSFRDLRRAHRVNAHNALCHADATRLPFRDGSFASILCNGVLCTIPDFERAVAEAHRVLRPDGLFALTVPTDHFSAALPVATLLGRVHPRLRQRYLKKLAARLPHWHELSLPTWCERLEHAGLRVVHTTPFLSRRESNVWNVLSMSMLRSFGVFRLPGISAFHPLWRGASRTLLGPLCSERPVSREDARYVLIVARRPVAQSTPRDANEPAPAAA